MKIDTRPNTGDEFIAMADAHAKVAEIAHTEANKLDAIHKSRANFMCVAQSKIDQLSAHIRDGNIKGHQIEIDLVKNQIRGLRKNLSGVYQSALAYYKIANDNLEAACQCTKAADAMPV